MKITHLDEMLDKLDKLFRDLKKIIFLRRLLWWILRKESEKALDLYFEIIQDEAYRFLIDLRSDIIFHLKTEQRKLKKAKWEIELKISGATHLENVSELQKARLDRQIEQFKELQKVLIKT